MPTTKRFGCVGQKAIQLGGSGRSCEIAEDMVDIAWLCEFSGRIC